MKLQIYRLILWIDFLNSNHFHKKIKISLIQNKVQFHFNYTQLNQIENLINAHISPILHALQNKNDVIFIT